MVLRAYPFQEADLVVSFLTRDAGKLRGVARGARRPKSRFGAGLERLSQVKMFYFQKETRELVDLDSCELVHSQFELISDYTMSVALDYIAEVSEQLLPAAEANERYYRLLVAVLDHLRARGIEGVWRAVVYFSLWAVRLAGFLPALHVCLECGAWLDAPESPERAYFTRSAAGLACVNCRTGGSRELTVESRALAREMLRKPVEQIDNGAWTRSTASDLRHYLVERIEDTIERRLNTAPVLEACQP